MKILYIANIRMPTEKAHGYQIMKMCSAFKRLGNDVELIVAKRFNKEIGGIDPFKYYNISEKFRIKKIFCVDLINPKIKKIGPVGFWVQTVTFILFLLPYLFFKKADYIYCRDELVVYILSFFKKNIVYEAHIFSRLSVKAGRRLALKKEKIIAISKGVKDRLAESGVNKDLIFVAPDGVDLDEFAIKEDQVISRKILGIPLSIKLVLYSGHLFDWKGVYVLADAGSFLPEDFLIIFVGGMPEDIERFKKYVSDKNYKNILIAGHKARIEIPRYLNAADVLVLPNSGKHRISKYYTSPIKLFEYMAMQRPIVAADLPSVREILDESMAYFFDADDPKHLAEIIQIALSQNNNNCVDKALQKAKIYSWQKRAENIINFLEQKI